MWSWRVPGLLGRNELGRRNREGARRRRVVGVGLTGVYVVWLLRASLTKAVNRLTGIEGWGVKFALSGGEEAMAAAFEIAAKNPKWTVEASEQ